MAAKWLLCLASIFGLSQSLFSQTCGSFIKIARSTGASSSVGIKSDGSLWAWGSNSSGQLGDGTTVTKISPVQIGTGTNWNFVASGFSHTIGIKSDGTIWAWGLNGNGQLGDGTIVNKSVPTQIGTATNWVFASGGTLFTAALKSDGTIWTWGQNSSGQLGDGTVVDKNAPVNVGTATNWVKLSCGNVHTLAIKADGTLWAWGANSAGQLGDGTTVNKNAPVQIGVATNWASVSCGLNHTLAIKTDGTLWAWGQNVSGQLGDGTLTGKTAPIQIGTATNWAAVIGGGSHSVAIKTDGTIWAWGLNSSGQLGDGTVVNKVTPVQIGTATTWNFAGCAGNCTAGIKSDGSLWTWGSNSSGQLGDGTTVNKNAPLQIGTPLPSAPVVSTPVNYLLNATATTLTATGTNLLWYTVATGGIGSATAPTPSTSTAGTTSYWVSQSTNSCEGPRAKIDVIVSSATHLNFDGVDDYVTCGNILTPSYTKEAWVYMTAAGQNNFVSGGTDGEHALWADVNNGNRLAAGHNGDFGGSWTYVMDPTPLTLNTWYHVAVTYDAATTTMKLYKNGALVSSNTAVPPFVAGNAVRLGSFDNAANLLQGNIDEVRIWNSAQTADDIQRRMNCELQGNEAGLIAYYKFNQGAPAGNNAGLTTLLGSTLPANNGTLNNFALTGTTSNWLIGSPVTTGSTIPSAPTASPQTFCSANNPTVANLVPAPSASNKWYNVATGGGALAGTTAIATGTYYVTSVNASGCESSRVPVSIIVSASPLATTNQTSTLSVAGVTNFPGCTNLIAVVSPNGAAPVSGNTTTKVWFEAVQPSQFVKRHYEITPASGAATATATVTLYFTQAEFNAFNAVNAVKLPTGPADATGIANLLIEKRGGVSSDGTGLPATYSGTVSTINPADANIVWNASASRWEISFDVAGFSGFFVKTSSSLLPLKWLQVKGKLDANKQAIISWQVSETGVSRYEIESGNDGNHFARTGTLAGKGDGVNDYEFTDARLVQGQRYYRILQIDQDGHAAYSTTIIVRAVPTSVVNVYPNPFNTGITISSTHIQTATLYDASGKVVLRLTLRKGDTTLVTSFLQKGMYVLKCDDGVPVKLVKE